MIRLERRDWGHAGLLFLMTLVFFWRLLSLENVWYQDDFSPHIIPVLHWLHLVYARGGLPLWCNGVLCGYPMFDEGMTGALYAPFRLIVGRFDYATAMLAYFSLHVYGCALGAYAFLRSRSVKPEAALFGAVLGAFGGGMVCAMHHWITLVSLAWFPWIMLGYFLCLEEGRRSLGAALLGLGLGLAILGGHLGIVLYELMALAVLHAWRLARRPSLASEGRAWAAFFAAALTAALLCGGQILATQSYGLQSLRAEIFNYGQASENSMSPASLLNLALPYLYGDANDASFLGLAMPLGTWLHQGMLAFCGFLALGLAWLGLRRKPGESLPFACAAGVLLWYALGSWGGLHWLLFHLPFFGHLRAPMKAAWLVPMLLALPAARGVEALSQDRALQPRAMRLLGALAVLLAASALWLHVMAPWIQGKGMRQLAESALGQGSPRLYVDFYVSRLLRWFQRLQSHLAEQAIFPALAAGLIFFGLRRRAGFLPLALALALFAELGWHGSRYQPVVDRSIFERPPATARELQALTQSLGRPARFIGWGWADLLRRSFPGGRMAGDVEGESKLAEVLGGNACLLYGLDNMRGYTPIGLKNVQGLLGDAVDFTTLKASAMDQALLSHRPALDDAGVRFIASSTELKAPDFALRSAKHLLIYENLRAKDLFRLASGAPLKASWLQYGDEAWELEAELKKPGRVELALSYYPGGQLGFVDGVERPILASGAAWCGFDLPAGRHRVKIIPDPARYRLALRLHLAGLLLAALLLLAAFFPL